MNIMRQVAATATVKLAEDGLWYQDPATQVWYRSESLLVKLITGRAVITK